MIIVVTNSSLNLLCSLEFINLRIISFYKSLAFSSNYIEIVELQHQGNIIYQHAKFINTDRGGNGVETMVQVDFCIHDTILLTFTIEIHQNVVN